MTLARTLWTNVEGEKSPYCRRCKSLVSDCAFVGTKKQDSSCLISMEIQRSDAVMLGRAKNMLVAPPASPETQEVDTDEKVETQHFTIPRNRKQSM